MHNNKKNQKIKAIVITILLAMSLVGAGAFGYFFGGTTPTPSLASGNSDYSGLQNKVNILNQKVRSNPNDIQLQQDLGNAYYDLATVAQKAAPNKEREDFIQAIKYYQNVLNTKQDINVLTDMATAAFYSGQSDLAEKSYKEALTENPDFQQALFDYGLFLFQIKKDYSSSILMWQTGLDKEPYGPNADRLKQLISQTKNMQATQQKADNPSANTPSNKTP